MTFGMLSILLAATVAASADHTNDYARQSGSIELNGPIDRVFPYFGPVREAEWAEGWAPEMIYLPARDGGEGAVFRTKAGDDEMLWTLARWDEHDHAITYITVIPGERLGRIDIECHAARDKTRCEVAYSYVALGHKGEEFIVKFTPAQHRHRLDHWQMAINHLLATGKRFEGVPGTKR